MSPTVAIIGAGLSGIASARACLSFGLQVTVFDRRRDVGGVWNLREPTPVYDSLTTNTSVFSTAFSDMPATRGRGGVDDGLRRGYEDLCLTAAELEAYVQRVTRSTAGLEESLRLGCDVRSVRRVRGDEADGFVVRYASVDGNGPPAGQDGEEEIRVDHVIVASGYYNTPKTPTDDVFPGLARYSGRVYHSGEYTSPAQCAGARVLVVGSSVSAGEIAADLLRPKNGEVGPASVALCARKKRLFLEKQNDSQTFTDAIGSRLRALQFRAGLNGGADFIGDFSDMTRKYRLEKEFDTPEKGLPAVTTVHGKLLDAVYAGELGEHLGGIVRIGSAACENENENDRKVTFGDGSEGEFDVIYFATGYRTELAFLDEETSRILRTGDMDGNVLGLHRHAMHPAAPGMWFVGMFPPAGSVAVMVDNQARMVARMIARPETRPSADAMRAGIAAYEATRRSPHWTVLVMIYEVVDEFARDGGFEVDLTAYKEWTKALLLGPFVPAQYRLCGVDATEHALADFEAQMTGNGFVKGDNTVPPHVLQQLKIVMLELQRKDLPTHTGLDEAVRYLFEVNDVPYDE